MTSTTLTAPAPRDEVLDRSSGELLDVREASTERLAQFLDDAAVLASELEEAKSAVEREVLRRMDANVRWTEAAGDFQLQAPSPEAATTYYDADQLADTLVELGRRGMITREAARAALTTDIAVERKARKAGIKKLLSRGGEVAQAVAKCQRRREEPPPRRVKVRRARRD